MLSSTTAEQTLTEQCQFLLGVEENSRHVVFLLPAASFSSPPTPPSASIVVNLIIFLNKQIAENCSDLFFICQQKLSGFDI